MADLLGEARTAADAAISAARMGYTKRAQDALFKVLAAQKAGKESGLCSRRSRMLQACVDDARAAVARC